MVSTYRTTPVDLRILRDTVVMPTARSLKTRVNLPEESPLANWCSAGAGSWWSVKSLKACDVVKSNDLRHRSLKAIRDARFLGRVLANLVSVRNGGRRDRGAVRRRKALVLIAFGGP